MALTPATQSLASSGAGVELVPIIVWQGDEVKPWQEVYLHDVLNAVEGFKVVHMLNPASFMGDPHQAHIAKSMIASLLRDGDGLGMHIAAKRVWLNHVGLNFDALEGLQGMFGTCHSLGHAGADLACGPSATSLDQSAFAKVLASGREVLHAQGFGWEELAMFDEGVVSELQWQAALGQKFEQDWSGFNLESTRERLATYPVFASNQKNGSALAAATLGHASKDGRSMDHIRFGLALDLIDKNSASEIIRSAIQLAQKSERTVMVPVMISAEVAVHYVTLLSTVIADVKSQTAAAQVPLKPWSGDGNSGWKPSELGNADGPPAVGEVSMSLSMGISAPLMPPPELIRAPDATEVTNQAVVPASAVVGPTAVSSAEAAATAPAEMAPVSAMAPSAQPPEVIPASQPLVPSHAMYMSH